MNKNNFECPFFEESSLTGQRAKKGVSYIECESPCIRADEYITEKKEAYMLYSAFRTEKKAIEHAERYCCSSRYEECPTYKMIVEFKYKD